jgi:flavin-dependent dehydrogenase
LLYPRLSFCVFGFAKLTSTEGVCVIGGGAAGKLHYMGASKQGYDVVTFEPLSDLVGNCEVVDSVEYSYVIFSPNDAVKAFFDEFVTQTTETSRFPN